MLPNPVGWLSIVDEQQEYQEPYHPWWYEFAIIGMSHKDQGHLPDISDWWARRAIWVWYCSGGEARLDSQEETLVMGMS